MTKIFRKTHRTMPEQDTELTLSKEASAAAASQADNSASEMPAQEPNPVQEPDKTAEEAPPVPRAEYDQLKAERERIADRDYAVVNVVEKFLPVLDHFEMALKSAGTVEQLRSGVELIVKQMEDVLRQLQVTAIPAEGAKFDPRHHEALGAVERLDMPDQHVAEEIRRGYKLRDKLLRPALVRVASNPKQTSE